MPKSYDFDIERPKISLLYVVVVFVCIWFNMTQKLNETKN